MEVRMNHQADRLSFFGILLLASFSLNSASGLAQTQSGGSNQTTPGRSNRGASHTIRGKIFLPSGNMPEQRIRVALELNTGGIAGETYSDSNGNFEFRNLQNNSYRVSVPSDNRTFETTQEVVECYGNFPRTFMVQVYLKDKNVNPAFRTKEKLLSVAELQEVPKAAKKAYEKGLKLGQQRKHEEAITHFLEALKAYPDYLLAHNKLGEQYLALNKSAEAQGAFQRAITINPKFALPHINLGIIHIYENRFEEAIREFEIGNRYDDTYPMAYLNLGRALMLKTPPDFDRSEKELMRALEMGGKNFVRAHLDLFNLNVRRRTLDKAVVNLETYLRDAPKAPDTGEVRTRLEGVKKLIAQQQGK
jgi:tetratricopeptide (TPR) repeat protein